MIFLRIMMVVFTIVILWLFYVVFTFAKDTVDCRKELYSDSLKNSATRKTRREFKTKYWED